MTEIAAAEQEAPKFGFSVRHEVADGAPDDSWYTPGGWIVELPHQCDGWEISGEYGSPAPHAEAIAALEAFITQAQEALTALRAEKEYGND